MMQTSTKELTNKNILQSKTIGQKKNQTNISFCAKRNTAEKTCKINKFSSNSLKNSISF